ncbi:trypsin-1 [Plutella xylostella]|uniref:trypsin-1 n=1 Tax=Plutella xylostella TaxID=51655 RepID=UPI0020329EC4|nr:trypsin-1 [Plutella xylostella]
MHFRADAHKPPPAPVGTAEISRWPFAVSPQTHLWGSMWVPHCAGALISTTTVLSAAQCYQMPSPRLRVRLGSTYSTFGGSLVPVSSYTNHPDYEPTAGDHDIALLRLAESAVLSAVVQLARIPAAVFPISDGSRVDAVGWGHLEYDDDASITLKEAALQTVNQDICTQRYANLDPDSEDTQIYQVTSRMLCAEPATDGLGMCEAGAPVVVSGDVVVGVQLWGFRCGGSVYPQVATRVSEYSDWIVANGS